jgi:RNA polymerase sigma factor (sigma-70 family)
VELAERPDKIGDLVAAADDGDDAAWTLLVERFGGLVWSVARGYGLGAADAADVFQVTWLRLTEHLGRIDHPERVGAWLATTARHEALRVLRTSARVVPTDDESTLETSDSGAFSPERAVLDAEQARLDADRATQLWDALGEMSARCQRLLRVLMASPPPRYAEVAAALDMPVGSIGPTRARCLAHLRERLARKGIDDPRLRS